MAGKTELYITITVLISLFLVFGGIHSNSAKFDGLFNKSHTIGNNSSNNSTTQENATAQLINNSSANPNQTIITSVNQTVLKGQNTTAKNQSTENIISNYINKILNLSTADLILINGTDAQETEVAAGEPKTGTTNIFINQTGKLPPIKTSLSLKQCLKPTVNAQSNNPSIKSLSKKITKGATSTYDKAVKIFNWVRDNIGYSFYYNTKYGAVKTLQKKTGNCVDTSHLLVALLRASGIPARYVHVKAKFTNGHWYGHVFVQAYIKGKWYNLDAISSRNDFNVIRNWDPASAKIKGVYASLPF